MSEPSCGQGCGVTFATVASVLVVGGGSSVAGAKGTGVVAVAGGGLSWGRSARKAAVAASTSTRIRGVVEVAFCMAAAWPGASRLGNAENTFSKDRRIHTRLSDRDMVGIQKVAAAEAVP